MRGDVKDAPLRVVAEPMHVNRPRILRLERYPGELLRGGLLIGAATTGHGKKRGCNRSSGSSAEFQSTLLAPTQLATR